MGGDGSGGGEGVLKAKSSGVIGESNGNELRLEAIEEEEDVPLADGVLNGALGAFGDMGLCFSDGVLASSWNMPWKCLRLKMNEKDDDLKNEETECYFEKYLPLVSLHHHQLVENYGRFGQKISKDKDLEDLLKKIKITEDIS
ncbi:hypothetical protein Tco_0911603 [Tanacetum coccineum]|uniref:Uncharacterized protein n=1 Tax=Tanacetum coccineum TaxID=301880 RepID=A0ABQ5CX99_9ASTR